MSRKGEEVIWEVFMEDDSNRFTDLEVRADLKVFTFLICGLLSLVHPPLFLILKVRTRGQAF